MSAQITWGRKQRDQKQVIKLLLNKISEPSSMKIFCTRPNCSQPDNHHTDLDDPEQVSTVRQKFCTSCRMPLILAERYLPISLLGRGGFGAAFLARDRYIPEKRHCVVKQFLPPENISDTALAMARKLFTREAAALSKLGSQHEQIPDLFAFFPLVVTDTSTGKDAEFFYLVQEYIEGKNLEEELSAKGKFSEQEVRYVLEEILMILEFVHENGSIHRDIKPSNIMRDKNNRLYLLDFGAVKQLSAVGVQIGSTGIYTLGYAPPEQMLGGQVFNCTDLYALAATCLHLLTGKRPEELYDAYHDSWNWQSFASPISSELTKVLNGMLQTKPKNRIQSATEALQALIVEKKNTRVKRDFECLRILSGHWNIVRAVAITSVDAVSSRVGQKIVSGGNDKTIKVWDITTDKCLHSIEGNLFKNIVGNVFKSILDNPDIVESIAITSDNQKIVSGSFDKTIKVWDITTGKYLYSLSGHSASILSLAITSDNQTIVSGSWDKTIKVWDIATKKCLYTLKAHSSDVRSVAITSNNKKIVSGSGDKTIKIWDMTTGECLHTLKGHWEGVRSVAITLDNQKIVSGGDDKTIKVWNMTTGECLHTLSGHSSDVRSVAITPNGQNIVSGSYDKTIRVWDMTTGKCLQTLLGHADSVTSIAISPDGKTIVTGSHDKTIRVWGIPE